jgi:peptidoglycan hydrolase-like protein with peptidoglycan-binding domain
MAGETTRQRGNQLMNIIWNARRAAVVAASAALLAGGALAPSAFASTSQVKPHALSSLCGFTSAQPTLAEGSSGTAVKQAQCELNWAYANGHGSTLAVDGSFGPKTLAVTRAFQSCVHISVDGVIGPNTWSELNFWVNQPGFACG